MGAGIVLAFVLGYLLASPSDSGQEDKPETVQQTSAETVAEGTTPKQEPTDEVKPDGKEAEALKPSTSTEQGKTAMPPIVLAAGEEESAPVAKEEDATPHAVADDSSENTDSVDNPFHPQGESGVLDYQSEENETPTAGQAEENEEASEPDEDQPDSEQEMADETTELPFEDDGALHGEIGKNEGFSIAAMRAGLGVGTINRLVRALEGILNVRQLRPGQRFEASLDEQGDLVSFRYEISDLRNVQVHRIDGELVPMDVRAEMSMRLETVAGRIDFSLSNALWRLGESDALTELIADVFAWDIDFFSDTQKGDEFKAIVEKYYYDGRFIHYGRVLTAEYIGKTVGDIRAYGFSYKEKGQEKRDFFNGKGESVRKSFLKAPLNTTRVTSKFGFRMHPTLNQRKKHNGVDFGAPTGTPIWAASNGTVIHSGWAGACGKMVKIRHANSVVTIYCHLSSIGVRQGQYVNQKQFIGRVGTTGRSTGPHLHYGMTVKGQYVNPLKPRYRPGKPIPNEHKEAYDKARKSFDEQLEKITVPQFYTCAMPPDYVDPTKEEAEAKTEASTAPTSTRRGRTRTQHRNRSNSRRNQARQGYNPPRPQGIHRAR